MIIINKLKKPNQYKPEKMPKFQHRLLKIAWLKRQRMKLVLSDVKSVSIQVKDINQMIYSKNSLLVSLYAKLNLSSFCNPDDYINIRKCKKNEMLIFELINTDWILKPQNFEGKTFGELREDYLCLMSQIDKQVIGRGSQVTDERLKLLRYKSSCLWELICQRDSQCVFYGEGVKKYSKKSL